MRKNEKKRKLLRGMAAVSLAGVGRHVLNNTGFTAFNPGNAVIILLGAGIDIHGLIDGGKQICLGSLPGQIGARNLHL